MGFLLKIILFGVAVYALWRTVMRWKGLFDRFTGRPPPPARTPPPAPPQTPPAAAPPAARGKVIDASATCGVCGAFLSSAATRCERPDCPVGSPGPGA